MARSRATTLAAGASRAVQVGMWLPVAHLGLLTLAGSLRPVGVTPQGPHSRFVVLIPARNEQDHIGVSVRSALTSAYPEELRRVVVVADNCTDATAAKAAAAGAEVWDRIDPGRASKGAAVGWALERLLSDDGWDAAVFLDADAFVEPEFLSAANARLLAGNDVVQGERHVTNAGESMVARLAHVSSAAQCVLRPRGRARLGGAAKLVGNGMVIRREVFDRCPWRAEGLVEDVEYWFDLLGCGVHPAHEPAAVVSDLMPVDIASARVQRSRWEAGSWNLLRHRSVPIARLAVQRRDAVLAEALVSELLLPNLSVTGAAIAGAGAVRWLVTRKGAGTVVAQSCVMAFHLVFALRAANAPASSYTALALAPVGAAWRVWVTIEAIFRRRSAEWRGTPRPPADPRAA
jgi:1,2-diacylglycerol 3-beta-glucosyltransferase